LEATANKRVMLTLGALLFVGLGVGLGLGLSVTGRSIDAARNRLSLSGFATDNLAIRAVRWSDGAAQRRRAAPVDRRIGRPALRLGLAHALDGRGHPAVRPQHDDPHHRGGH
jgi:hypothetical protein